MYDVSETYINKLFSVGVKHRRIRGYVDDVPFTECDIVAESLTITDKCLSSDDIKLGGVFLGQLDMTFLPTFAVNITRGTWKDRIINMSIGLELSTGVWEDVPLKPYHITEANHSKNGITITAYDAMEYFDRNINFDTSSGLMYDFANLACQTVGVDLALTSQEMKALPNGNITLGLYPENDMETLRDLISWLAVTMGGYATINRDGELTFRTWHDTPDLTIDIYHRDVSGKWSDFTTYYTGLSVVNIADGITEYHGTEHDTGLTMNIGSNPFMQYGVKEVKDQMCDDILEALSGFVYTPFNSNSFIDVSLDLGDVIKYTDGLAGDYSICCVHKIVYSYAKGVKLTGYGKNPALFGAKSKTDKNIQGLLSQSNANEIIAHTFVNTSAIDVDSTPTSILSIRFATVNAKFVKFLGEIILDTEADTEGEPVTVTVYYYVNDELQSYTPQTSWDNDGKHLLSLLYWLQNLAGGQTHKFEAYIKITGGTATIDVDGVHTVIEGQGLIASESWDGFIEVEDGGYNLTQHAHGIFNYVDEIEEPEFRDIDRVNISEEYALTQHTHGMFNYIGSCDVITHKTEYDIISSDEEYNIGSSDSEYYIGTAE